MVTCKLIDPLGCTIYNETFYLCDNINYITNKFKSLTSNPYYRLCFNCEKIAFNQLMDIILKVIDIYSEEKIGTFPSSFYINDEEYFFEFPKSNNWLIKIMKFYKKFRL